MEKTMTTTEEQWKDIKEFPGYKVSNLGRVASCFKRTYAKGKDGFAKGTIWVPTNKIQRILAPISETDGKYKVILRKDMRNHHIKIATIVLDTFIQKKERGGRRVVFKDGDVSNVSVDNLSWYVPKFPIHVSQKPSVAILARADKVRYEYKISGKNQSDIAKELDVSYSLVSRIVNNKICNTPKLYKFKKGDTTVEISDLNKFCQEQKLDRSHMAKVWRFDRKSHRGWERVYE